MYKQSMGFQRLSMNKTKKNLNNFLCLNDILDILGYIKYIIKINSTFLFTFFISLSRKFTIKYVTDKILPLDGASLYYKRWIQNNFT